MALYKEEFDVLLTDNDEAELLGHVNEIEHLFPGTFSSLAFPAYGGTHGINIRYMIPLVCQRAGKPNSGAINIWFLDDLGSPFTCLSLKSLEALLGSGNATNAFYSIAIQTRKATSSVKFLRATIKKSTFSGLMP